VKPILVIGLGNPLKADDGVGSTVAEMLKAKQAPGLEIISNRGEGLDLMSLWAGRDKVLVIDAIRSNSMPGTLHRFEAHSSPVPTNLFGRSTHTVSLAESVELARALGQLPRLLFLYGIEAVDFTLGADMSEPVRQAIPKLVEKIIEDMR